MAKFCLVKCASQEQSDKFRSISQIGSISIEVELFPHERLNAIKGVITSEVICNNSDEVLQWVRIREFPVTSIYGFPRRQTSNGAIIQTAYLAIQLHKLPKEVDIAFECSTLYTTPSTFVVNGMVMSIDMRCVQQGCSRGQDLPRPRHGWPRPRPSKLGLEARPVLETL